MSAKNALGIVLLWGVTFACVGGLIGATLGVAAPDYYRSLFREGRSPDFDPLQVGIGLGVTQGLAAGVAIALGVLALLTWRDVRAANANSKDQVTESERMRRPWSRLVLWSLATTVAIVLCCAAAFALGAIAGQQQLYQAWKDQKLRSIARILESNEFPNLQTDSSSSAAQVHLTGEIENEAKRQELRDELVLAFGTKEAEEMIWRVKIAK